MKHPLAPGPAPLLPRQIPLPDQAAAALRERLAQGEWGLRLPGEKDLAALLHVGRNTIRAALAILEGEGLVRTTNGTRRTIARKRSRARVQVRRAVLLMSGPESGFPPSTARWIQGARSRLETLGWRFRIVVEPEAYRRSPATLLQSLTAGWPDALWILHRSTAAMQRWFQDRQARVVLAGSRHHGITLPHVDTDFRAASRHAAGRLRARGHRVLAVLRMKAPTAGDDECVSSFREALPEAEVTELRCQNNPASVVRTLNGVLHRPVPPTALYVLHPEHCVTAMSFLMHRGIAIPAHMSVICRDDEPYLALLKPEPTRYRRSADAFASRLAALVTECDRGLRRKGNSDLIMPASVEGETIAGAPGPKKSQPHVRAGRIPRSTPA